VVTLAKQIEVQAYAAVGVPHHQIATLMHMETATLLKLYQPELTIGKGRATAQVGKALFKMATNGNVAAAIFWMKAQAGWRETQVLEHAQVDPAMANRRRLTFAERLAKEAVDADVIEAQPMVH
jgi:hypothetical protein